MPNITEWPTPAQYPEDVDWQRRTKKSYLIGLGMDEATASHWAQMAQEQGLSVGDTLSQSGFVSATTPEQQTAAYSQEMGQYRVPTGKIASPQEIAAAEFATGSPPTDWTAAGQPAQSAYAAMVAASQPTPTAQPTTPTGLGTAGGLLGGGTTGGILGGGAGAGGLLGGGTLGAGGGTTGAGTYQDFLKTWLEGYGQKQQAVAGTQKAIMNIEDELNSLEKKINERIGRLGGVMTEAQRQRQHAVEARAPRETLTKLMREQSYAEAGLAGERNLLPFYKELYTYEDEGTKSKRLLAELIAEEEAKKAAGVERYYQEPQTEAQKQAEALKLQQQQQQVEAGALELEQAKALTVGTNYYRIEGANEVYDSKTHRHITAEEAAKIPNFWSQVTLLPKGSSKPTYGAEKVATTADITEYNYAKSQGYTGTFQQWTAKKTTPTPTPTTNLATTLYNVGLPQTAVSTKGKITDSMLTKLGQGGIPPQDAQEIMNKIVAGSSLEEIRQWMRSLGVDPKVLDTFMQTLQGLIGGGKEEITNPFK